MARLDIERQHRLEPQRMVFAEEELRAIGMEIVYKDDQRIIFVYKENQITLWPYSGWFSGKGIRDGRGLRHLIKQLKQL